ncbi:MAG: HPr kinase/phosphorylase [Bosea sp. (in: a-proteobacteria)]
MTIHATTVVIGSAAILLRGASGTGKSSLGLELIRSARQQSRFARLVADDRTMLSVRAGLLIARPVPSIAGYIERRGLGLTPEPHLEAAVVGMVVDCLGKPPERMPEAEALTVELEAILLPRIAVHGQASDAALVEAAWQLMVDR